MKTGIGFLVALSVHLLFGWPFSLAGGAATGSLVGGRAWLWGGLAVSLAWAVLVGYNFLAAPAATGEMVRVMAEILGNMPRALFVVLSLLIGALLGALGGQIGFAVARLTRPPFRRP
jgi:hypothetical protein